MQGYPRHGEGTNGKCTPSATNWHEILSEMFNQTTNQVFLSVVAFAFLPSPNTCFFFRGKKKKRIFSAGLPGFPPDLKSESSEMRQMVPG